MSGPGLKEMITSSGFLPHRLNADDGTLDFAAIDRAAFRRMTFHDGRDFTPDQIKGPFLLSEIFKESLKPPPDVHYIFHSAFCCSTLLARCLEKEGEITSLREPNLLLDLANLKRFKHSAHSDPDRWQQTLGTALTLLAKAGGDGQRVLMKPTNIVNNIAAELIKLHPQTKALLLYSDLRSFLISLIKKGEPGMAFARQTFQILALDSDFVQSIPKDTLQQLGPFHVIALVWRMQMEAFSTLLATFPKTKVASLDSRHLLDNPAATLKKVSDFYGYEMTDADIEAIASGPLFHSHSKITDRSFDAGERSEENQQVEDKFGDELDQIVAWEKTLTPESPMAWPLAHALEIKK